MLARVFILIATLLVVANANFIPASPNIAKKGSRFNRRSSVKGLAPKRFEQDTLVASGSPAPATVPPSTDRSGAFVKEVLAGLVVSLATIPTSISYATVVGVKPLIGIWSSAICGFFASLIGGAPGIIVGSAGVVALPMARVFSQYGAPTMAAALMIASVQEILFGAFGLSKLCDIVTEPVITGFMNALAIFIVKSQLKIFQKTKGVWLYGEALYSSLAIAGLTFSSILALIPLRDKIKVPPQLVALVLATAATTILKLPIKTLADFAGRADFTGGLAAIPKFNGLPQIQWSFSLLQTLLGVATGVAMVSIVETLLAQRISRTFKGAPQPGDEPDQPNRAMIGLGVANLISSTFGGFGGCGLVPNSILNNTNGGRSSISVLSYALCTVIAVMLFSPLLGMIPMAALAGLMLTVAKNTFELKETMHLLSHATHSLQAAFDTIAMLVTTYLAFDVDMGIGIAVGVVITKLPLLFGKFK